MSNTQLRPIPRTVAYMARCSARGCATVARLVPDTTATRWTSGRYRRPVDVPAFTVPVRFANRGPDGTVDPDRYGWRTEHEVRVPSSLGFPAPQCVEHRRPLTLKPLTGVASDASCDPRCEGATGFQCECSCAGANHGKAHGA